jgi:hypothetical protein
MASAVFVNSQKKSVQIYNHRIPGRSSLSFAFQQFIGDILPDTFFDDQIGANA